MAYYVVVDGLGAAQGFYSDAVSTTIPPTATLIPDAVYAAWCTNISGQVLVNGALQPYVAPAFVPTVPQAVAGLAVMLEAKQAAGVNFSPAAGGGGPFLFATDPGARQNLLAGFTAAAAGLWNSSTWIAADGTPVPMVAADVTALATLAFHYVDACVATYATLHAAVLANPSADITQGWPANS